MNIFMLDKNPQITAQYHCDKHVVKMLVEYAQLMSTAHRVLDNIPPTTGEFYRLTHKNHPSAIWVRESSENYNWLYALWHHLHQEFIWRYLGGSHASYRKLSAALAWRPKNLPTGPMTPLRLAIANPIYHRDDPVESYRAYYNGDKARFATWKNTSVPPWFTGQQ